MGSAKPQVAKDGEPKRSVWQQACKANVQISLIVPIVLRVIQTFQRRRGLDWLGLQATGKEKGPLYVTPAVCLQGLGLADAKYRGAALRADTLGGRALVLQGDLPWTLDFHLLLAFHAVCLCHSFQPPFLQDLR
jgi:hypothetical protein